MDMFPTFAALAGADVSGDKRVDGVNILPLLLDQEGLPPRHLFWKMRDEKAVRVGPWKLISLGGNPPELYNLDKDLGETNNIAGDHPERVEGMLKAYGEWHSDVSGYAEKFQEQP
jgi:arylsulfatase A-like enzyme